MSTDSTSPEAQQQHRPDRRRHPRVATRGMAGHVQTVDASMPGLAVENLSQGGVFVRCNAALEPGTPVMVQLVRPGSKRVIAVQGRVVTVIAPAAAKATGTVAGMGIRLDRGDRDAATQLRQLVEELAPAGTAARDRTIQELEDAVQTLRREILRRNRTIGDLALRLAALDAAPGGRARRPPAVHSVA